MFLIRTAFWLSLVILFLPTGPDGGQGDSVAAVAEPDGPSATQAIVAAREAMADLSGFCGRNPETCDTGSAALKVFGQKAQYGAQMVYEYLADLDLGDGTVEQGPRAASSEHATNDTLRPTDLEVPWSGPDDVRG